MTQKIVIALRWMVDTLVHNSASQSIAILLILVVIGGEEPGVVSLLDNNIGDLRLIAAILLQFTAGGSDGHQLPE